MTLRTASYYTGLITPQHADKPNFVGTVALSVQPLVDLQASLAGMAAAFDLDAAEGVQLDIDGLWIGASRVLPVPIANYYFALDIAGVGLDQGYIQGPYADTFTVGALDDPTYRRLLYTKIAANAGDATTPSAEAILGIYFDSDATNVIVQDNGSAVNLNTFFSLDDAARGLDGPAVLYQAGLTISTLPEASMSMTIGICGQIPSILDLEVLAQGLIPVAPAGVENDILVVSVTGSPLFGLDIDNEYIGGLDRAALGVPPAYLAGLLTGEFN